jgi:tRNA acetyltransferase TAN1
MHEDTGPVASYTLRCEGSFLSKFNMLIGCPRERERAAQSEIQYFIGDLLEDSELQIFNTSISGLLTCRTTLNPFEVVHHLRTFAIENPYQFRFAIRFTPFDFCVETNLDIIKEAARDLLEKIPEDETFRVTVRRRHTQLENMHVVIAVADQIPRKVNLDSPDHTVLVEIVGEWTGIAVLKEASDILSIMSIRKDYDMS